MRIIPFQSSLQILVNGPPFLYICLLYLTLGVGNTGAEPRLAPENGTLSHDFGETRRSENLKWEIRLKNTGASLVKISQVQFSCGGCSPLRLNRETVPPGEFAILTVRFDSGKQRGAQTRQILLRTQDANSSGSLALTAKWNVRAFLEVQPEHLDFGRKLYVLTYDGRISLDVEGLGQAVHITSASCDSTHVRLGQPKSDAGNKRIVLPLSVLPTTPVGKFKAKVVLTTDYPKEPRLVIPITGTVQGPFALKEGVLSFGVAPLGKRVSRALEINTVAGGTERITGVAYDKSFLECSLTPGKQGGYLLNTSLLPTLSAGLHQTTITLQTSCAAQPRIDLPALAVIK